MTSLHAPIRPDSRHRWGGRWVVGGVSVVVASILFALATTLPAAAGSRGTATVKVLKTAGPLGTVFVSGQGRTVYVDIHDRANHVTCTGPCARSWPPLLLARGTTRPIAGRGVQGLGTVRRPGHRLQVTWHKKPLYLFAGDVHPGQINGQAVGAAFFVLTPKGVLRSEPSASTSTSSPGAPTTGTAPAPTSGVPASPVPGSQTPTAGAGASGTPAVTSPPATSPPATSPPATSPPATSPPAPSRPPVTSPPTTSRPPTTSPPTTAPAGGGVAY